MRPTLRIGSTGDHVKALQNALGATYSDSSIACDGFFGPETENAVRAFQRASGLYDDGIVGRRTWRALGFDDAVQPWGGEDVQLIGWRKKPADVCERPHESSYSTITLRADVAAAWASMKSDLNLVGVPLHSSGGRRSLSAHVGRNRSATSMHYLGRAFDLYVGAAMGNPLTDPYVVVRDEDDPRKWVVWARADEGEERILQAWNHSKQAADTVAGVFVNLTRLFKLYGFERISARRSYSKTNHGAAEWWHFQYEVGLEEGVTKFGTELLKVWSRDRLEGTAPWGFRDAVFGVDFF